MYILSVEFTSRGVHIKETHKKTMEVNIFILLVMFKKLCLEGLLFFFFLHDNLHYFFNPVLIALF